AHLLERPELARAGGCGRRRRVAAADGPRQFGRRDLVTHAQDDGVLDGVLELADVARKRVPEQELASRSSQPRRRLAVVLGCLLEKDGREDLEVLPVAAQG